MDQNPLKIGWISYLNLIPLRVELEKKFGSRIFLQEGNPSQVSHMLQRDQVSMAPVSSICLLKNPEFKIANLCGVSCDGSVQSVYWGIKSNHLKLGNFIEGRVKELRTRCKSIRSSGSFHSSMDYQAKIKAIFSDPFHVNAPSPSPVQAEFADLMRVSPSIMFSRESHTSNALSEVIYYLVFGKCAASKPMSSAGTAQPILSHSPQENYSISVLIGDEALKKRKHFTKIVDLGRVWKLITGLPFVFAIWQMKNDKKISKKFEQDLCRLNLIAQEKMHCEPGEYLNYCEHLKTPFGREAISSYWKGINYVLGANELHSLKLYLSMYKQLQGNPLQQDCYEKIISTPYHVSSL